MFSWFNMAFDYEQRKVDRYEGPQGMVSTARVTDSRDPFETAIEYAPWGDRVIVVQTYTTREDAQTGHQRYVELMLTGGLPQEVPRDAGTNLFSELARQIDAASTEGGSA